MRIARRRWHPVRGPAIGAVAALVILAAVVLGMRRAAEPEAYPKPAIADLEDIRERGHLVAATSFSPHSYFVYRGRPMGYSYELLERLGERLEVGVEIEVIDTLEDMLAALEQGMVDLVAHPLNVTALRQERVAFTRTLYTTPQVLVQRLPENHRRMTADEIEAELLREPAELDGKTVMLRRNSAYVVTLRSLMEELGIEIDLHEAPGRLTTDELIRRVATEALQYTVADRNIAQVSLAYHDNLDIETELSRPLPIAWALSHEAPRLLEEVDAWLEEEQQHADYHVIYRRYFVERRIAPTLIDQGFFALGLQRISPYDEIIKEYAETIDWDWRLLAALIFHESQFRPDARSWAGARGLMQLMPRTARAFGARNPDDPYQSIAAGTRFIAWLQEYWEERVSDADERLRFVLASYNVGHGHVQDARRLAEEHGADPQVWSGHVERYMLKKSRPEYFRHEVVRHGYARGEEPVNYVRSVLALYRHYSRLVDVSGNRDVGGTER